MKEHMLRIYATAMQIAYGVVDFTFTAPLHVLESMLRESGFWCEEVAPSGWQGWCNISGEYAIIEEV